MRREEGERQEVRGGERSEGMGEKGRDGPMPI